MNLSNIELTEDDLNLLSMGLKYISSTHKTAQSDINNALNNTIRRLLLHDFFSRETNNRAHQKLPFMKPSDWTPPISQISESTLSLIQKLRTETHLFLNTIPMKNEFYIDKFHKNNLAPKLRNSIKKL